MSDQEQDDLDAAYAQQEGEERRHFEDRILARAQKVYDEFHQGVKDWLKEHV